MLAVRVLFVVLSIWLGFSCTDDGDSSDEGAACAGSGMSCSLQDCCEGMRCFDDSDESRRCYPAPTPCSPVGEVCQGDDWCCSGLMCQRDGDVGSCIDPNAGSTGMGESSGSASSSG